MVSKSGLDLQRRDRSGPPRNLAPSDFFHVPAKPRQYRNSVPYLAAHGKCSRSRLLNRPKSSLSPPREDVQEVARVLGLQIKSLIAGTDRELDAALASLAQIRPDALMVNGGPLSFTRADKIVVAAEQLAIPAMYFRREFALAGGLMSYGTNTDENFRVMGEYTGRILKGEKPGDLPIQQPTKFELVINLKTAKALGLTIPETLLATAD